MFRIVLLNCLLLCQAHTAETGISGSILGFVFDPANGVQPILGIAGSATIGAPLDLRPEITKLSVSSQQSYALAATTSDPNLVRISLSEPVSVQPLGIPIGAAGLIAISPGGSTAAIYDRDRNRILAIDGLPAAEALVNEFDLSRFDGAVVSVAVNDGGEIVLVGFPNKVFALGGDGSVTSIEGPQRATAIRFLGKSRDAVIADGGGDALYLVRNLLGSPETTILAGGILKPVAVAVSNDNKLVFAASSVAGSITAVELSSGSVTVTSCPCSPSGLTGMNGNAVFRLTEPTGGPLWLFDGDAPRPRTVFVPPYRPAPTEEEFQ